jgi:hypothetical protein
VDKVSKGNKVLPWSLILRGLALALIAWYSVVIVTMGPEPGDALSYWETWREPLYTDVTVGRSTAFLYSPVVAQLIYPVTLLPFEAFRLLLFAGSVGALLWMAGPLWALPLLLIPQTHVAFDLAVGNIHLLLGAAIVAGFRHPGWWAFPLLTKVTPGIGLWYFGWRQFAIGLGVTLGLIGVSALIAPHLWLDWLTMLRSAPSVSLQQDIIADWPLVPRLVVAAGIVAVARWRQWPWLVPVACWLVLPVLWLGSTAVLVAVVALTGPGRRSAHEPGTSPSQRPPRTAS